MLFILTCKKENHAMCNSITWLIYIFFVGFLKVQIGDLETEKVNQYTRQFMTCNPEI